MHDTLTALEAAREALPPLPEPDIISYVTDSVMRSYELHSFSEQQMRAYALASLASLPKPLTEEEIDKLDTISMAPSHRQTVRAFARAIERAHGIGNQPPEGLKP